MSKIKRDDPLYGQMSVGDAGRKGGNSTKRNHGKSHYSQLGKETGAMLARDRPGHFAQLAAIRWPHTAE